MSWWKWKSNVMRKWLLWKTNLPRKKWDMGQWQLNIDLNDVKEAFKAWEPSTLSKENGICKNSPGRRSLEYRLCGCGIMEKGRWIGDEVIERGKPDPVQ